MNKWQIICPVVAMLIVGIVIGSQWGRREAKAMHVALERHLGSVLSELENRQEGGRFPSAQVAQSLLQDEAIAKRVHTTSLFGTEDLYYNPEQPFIGSQALVLCARTQSGLVGIQADRTLRLLSETALRQAHLVPLAGTRIPLRAEPRGVKNGSQPMHSVTNGTLPAAESRRSSTRSAI